MWERLDLFLTVSLVAVLLALGGLRVFAEDHTGSASAVAEDWVSVLDCAGTARHYVQVLTLEGGDQTLDCRLAGGTLCLEMSLHAVGGEARPLRMHCVGGHTRRRLALPAGAYLFELHAADCYWQVALRELRVVGAPPVREAADADGESDADRHLQRH